jgi:putative FmdB family regulatory protein
MPIYEYRCAECEQKFEKRRRMSQADDEIACPECGSLDTSRGLSMFAAFSKGNGGTSVSVGGGSGCGGCASHSCGSCGRH